MPSPAITQRLIREECAERFGIDDRLRCGFIDRFENAPLIEADLDWDPGTTPTQTEWRLLAGANRNWVAQGTNMTSALATIGASGGILLTSAGTTNDQAIIGPASVASGATFLSGAGGVQWSTAKSVEISAVVQFASVASIRWMVGLKLTNTPTLATDDDQVMFHFNTTAATTLQCVTSVAGVDTSTDATTAVGIPILTAAIPYHLRIALDADRRPAFYVNGQFITKGPAMTSLTTLKPFIGCQTLTSAAKSIAVRHVKLSRLY